MAENFDLFNFEHCDSMLDLLSDPGTTIVDAGDQVVADYPDPPGTSCLIGVLSGELANGAFSTADARISHEPSAVGVQFTVEWAVTFEELPDDFASLIAQHVYLGASDGAGPCAGLFVSTDGIAYTGSVHHVANNLVIDSDVTPIPGTAAHIVLDVELTIRLVVDGPGGVVYLYITPTTELTVTGHRLVAVLGVLDAADMAFTPIDQVLVSVRGTTLEPSRIAFDAWRMSNDLLIPNQPPIASAGSDQAVRICSVAELNGLDSFDVEGSELTYEWRLIGAPFPSSFSVDGNDGRTYPLGPPTGFTNLFHSISLGLAHADDELEAGDVLVVAEVSYDIVTTGTDGNGFFVQIDGEILPEPLPPTPYRVYRQRGISGATTAKPTFLPDVLGFYRFSLVVDDGNLPSQPSVVVLNVVDSPLPRGVIPDASFVFSYLSDYWSLVEDREVISTLWSGMAQVVASELYTLWQHDYGKSLRDIQRTFLRRWLHYDLLLGEPLSELTTLRPVSGGVTTDFFGYTTGASLNGNSFRIASPFHATTTIAVLGANPVLPMQLGAELRNRLLELDSRYTVSFVITLQYPVYLVAVRVNAPFPFTITNVTGSILNNGVNGVPSGTGEVTGLRTFRIDGDGLNGIGVGTGDLIIIGGEAYLIQEIKRNDTTSPFTAKLADGEYTDQNVTVTADLPADATTWSLPSLVTSELLDFYSGLVSAQDYVFFEVSGNEALTQVRALGVSEGNPGLLGIGYSNALVEAHVRDPSGVQLAKLIRATYLPIADGIVDIPTLVELIEIQDDTATLRRNVDFYIEDFRGQHCLRFDARVWEDDPPPDRLWAEYTYVDNRPTIEDNFGLLAGVTVDQIAALPGEVDYLSAVRGIWYAYINGPTMRNLRVGSQILLGLPFAEEAGTIEEIRTDFSPTRGRILIRDAERTEIVRSYTFPKSLELELNPATGVPYMAGDSVVQFAPLVQGVEVIDYVSDPDWFQGLLNQGIFYEVEKFHKFLVRVDAAAFGVDSLSFVREFILQIKPAITQPLFIVQQDLGDDTEVSITDELRADVTVRLLDVVCGLSPFSTSFDDPRLSGGGFWNQFDTDSDDGTAPPTPPTSDSPISWGFDRYIVCPSDDVDSHTTQVFSGPALASTGLNFVPGDDLYNVARFMESGPFVVATGATGEAITAEVGATEPDAGTIDEVRVLISGGPGASPTNYEVVVAIGGVDTIIQAFTSVARYTDVSFAVSAAVVASDVITARIRHAGGAPRSPAWTHVRIEVHTNLGPWVGGDLLAAGNYGFLRTLA